MRKALNTIEFKRNAPHLILCEGADAYYFLIHLLVVFGNNESFFEQFCVYDFGGIKDLRQYLHLMCSMDDFRNIVKSLSIVRDAEMDAVGACQSIMGALRDVGLASPNAPCSWTSAGTNKYPDIRTGFVLFPSCDANPENGTLEHLCLRMLSADNAKSVLTDADTALERHRPHLPRLHKNRLHTYFSLTDKAEAFDWNAPEIESLKSFLRGAVT